MFDQLFIRFSGDSLLLQIAVLLAVTLVASLIAAGVLAFLGRRAEQSKTIWDDAFVHALATPVQLMIWLVGVGLAGETVAGTDTPIARAIAVIRDVGTIVALAWFLIRFIHNFEKNLILRAAEGKGKIDRFAITSFGKLLRLTTLICATLIVLQTLGFSVAGVLTFGGIGGIAIGLAAKDMLSNFFGGLMLYLDRPFSAGDWIRSPDRQIEGIVEEMKWRVTIIRTLESRPLYVPNSSFSTIAIENITRMQNRRIYEVISIRYDDAAAMDDIVAQVKALLQGHDGIDQEQSLMVSFTTFAPSSLDFFIYCFTKTQNGMEYFRIKQEIMLAILQIIDDNNAECAFPTTTMHMKAPPPTGSDSPKPMQSAQE